MRYSEKYGIRLVLVILEIIDFYQKLFNFVIFRVLCAIKSEGVDKDETAQSSLSLA